MNKLHKTIISGVLMLSSIMSLSFSSTCFADEEKPTQQLSAFAVSPMFQNLTLVPGERTYGTFKITNPESSINNFYYKTSIAPYKVTDGYDIKFENNGDYSQIADWITIVNGSGVIAPNNTEIIQFYIDVPESAPAGGQYAAIVVESDPVEAAAEGLNIHERYSISHILTAEVAGETIRKGEINSIAVPGFLFSGKIYGASSIKNIGNVHSDAIHTLQIFPLFSNEELYTNEEDPEKQIVYPNTTRTNTIYWEDTPSVGIFHVIYNVEYEGVESKVDKIVIVCPLWLLFLIILAIFLIIFKIWSGKKREKK